MSENETEKSDRIKTQAALISQKYGPFLKLKDAGSAAGFSKSTVVRAVKRGEIEVSRLSKSAKGGRCGTMVIAALDLAKWIESLKG